MAVCNDGPTPIGELVPEVLRDIWERGRVRREAAWTPAEIAEIESDLGVDPKREAAE